MIKKIYLQPISMHPILGWVLGWHGCWKWALCWIWM